MVEWDVLTARPTACWTLDSGWVLGRRQMTAAREHRELIGRRGPSLLGQHDRIVLARHDQERHLPGPHAVPEVE